MKVTISWSDPALGSAANSLDIVPGARTAGIQTVINIISGSFEVMRKDKGRGLKSWGERQECLVVTSCHETGLFGIEYMEGGF